MDLNALSCIRSEIAANLKVFEFIKLFVKFSKRWASAGVSRHGVTAPKHVSEITGEATKERVRNISVVIEGDLSLLFWTYQNVDVLIRFRCL